MKHGLLALFFATTALAAPRYETVPNQFLVTTKVRELPSTVKMTKIDGFTVVDTVSRERGEYVVEFKDRSKVPTASTVIETVEPVYVYHVNPVKTKEPEKMIGAAPVNDPLYSSLWGIAKINAPAAWAKTVGSTTGPLVAIIDTGVDYEHVDLKSNVPTKGYSAITGEPDGIDDNSHGTHVAGTIAAIGNNSVGVVGVGQKGRLVASKFLNADGAGTSADAIKAIDWAVAQGARVLNNSWGGGGPSKALESAIKRACDKGAIFVAAAGNEANNNDVAPSYPASYKLPCVVAVAATDAKDKFATFSNYGRKSVHVAAPGVQILSTVPDDKYATYSGTSMATPHVVGALALLLTKHPELTGTQAIDRLFKTTDKLPCKFPFRKCVKYGRLNAGKLLE